MSLCRKMLFITAASFVACNGDKDPTSTDSGTAIQDSGVDTSLWIDDGGPTIFEIQQGIYALDSIISLEGVTVSSPFTGYGFFITEPQGGAQSGIWVYTGDIEESEISIQMGDRIAITGVVDEYFGDKGTDSLTELILETADNLEVLGEGNLPEPELLSTTELADPATAELWEGCLVAVENVTVTDDYPATVNGWWMTASLSMTCLWKAPPSMEKSLSASQALCITPTVNTKSNPAIPVTWCGPARLTLARRTWYPVTWSSQS